MLHSKNVRINDQLAALLFKRRISGYPIRND